MRTLTLPSMLDILAGNMNRRNMDVKLYELAKVYRPVEGKVLAAEYPILTLGAYGSDCDFFAIKGCVEAILADMRITGISFKAERCHPSYHPGRCAAVYSGDVILGYMGQVHPTVCENYDIPAEVFAAELSCPEMMARRAPEPTYTPLPRFPAITRDIAVVCDASIPVAELISTINAADDSYLKGCELFDVYTGAPIPEGKKSVAFSLTLRSDEMTLTDEHAEAVINAVLEALKANHGASMR